MSSTLFSKLLTECQQLEKQVQSVATTDVDKHDGRLFLLQMLQTTSINTDGLNPRFVSILHSHSKYFADCPDTDYFQSGISFYEINKNNRYTVSIKIHPQKTLYAGLVIYGKGGRISVAKPLFFKHNNNKLSNPHAPLNLSFLIACKTGDGVDDINNNNNNNSLDNEKELILADEDTVSIVLRQYYENRNIEIPMECKIKLISSKNPQANMVNNALRNQIAGRSIKLLKRIVNNTIGSYKSMIRTNTINKTFRIGFDPNGGTQSEGNRLFGTVANDYKMAFFEMNKDKKGEILKMTINYIPKCVYFGICLYNFWMQSLDYNKCKVNINHSEMIKENDGRKVIIYLVGDDESKDRVRNVYGNNCNVLESDGHYNGLMIIRALYLKDDFPDVIIEKVNIGNMGAVRAKL